MGERSEKYLERNGNGEGTGTEQERKKYCNFMTLLEKQLPYTLAYSRPPFYSFLDLCIRTLSTFLEVIAACKYNMFVLFIFMHVHVFSI